MKVARIVTVPEAFVHIEFQIKEFKAHGYEVDLICSPKANRTQWEHRLNTAIIPLEIPREISVIKDFKALVNLILLFRKKKYDIVHSSTPKAGLLVAIAGFIAGIPIRLHTFTGQRWATMRDFKRNLLKIFDRFMVTLNTRCYADSQSQIDFLRQERIDLHSKIICLGEGSYGGVDTTRFHPLRDRTRAAVESTLTLSPTAFRFMYLGRLVADKGLNELISAFDRLSKKENCQLLLVGPESGENDPISEQSKMILKNNSSIHIYGPTNTPEELLQISDILMIPSYREGFGTVVIEAAACRVPAIGTQIPGLKDAIINGKTGILVPVKSIDDLYGAMEWAVNNKEAIQKMASSAYERCLKTFDSRRIAELVISEYQQLYQTLRNKPYGRH